MESGIVVNELASRTESREWELTSEKDDIARFLPRNRFWPPQCEQPLRLRELPEVELWTAKMCLQATGVRHFGDLAGIFFDGKLVQGERGGLVGDLQVPVIDPHRYIFPGQPPLAIKASVLEFHEAVAINLASELRGVQRTREHLFGEGPAHRTPRSTEAGLCRPSWRSRWA